MRKSWICFMCFLMIVTSLGCAKKQKAIHFTTQETKAILAIDHDGKIFLRGELIGQDKELGEVIQDYYASKPGGQ